MSTFPGVFAHELVPEPADSAPLAEHTRYHLARAIGLQPGFDVPNDAADRLQFSQRILLWTTQCRVTLLLVAAELGLAGDELSRFVTAHCHEEVGEFLHQWARERNVEPRWIRRYLLPYELKGAGDLA